MTGNEFLRRIRRLSRKTGVPCRLQPRRGKESHQRFYYGARLTTLKDLKKEIGSRLLSKMLRDLGLKRADIE